MKAKTAVDSLKVTAREQRVAGEDEAMSGRGGVAFALVMGEIGEEDASGDEGDDGGGLVGLSADDAGTSGPEECGDSEDAVKPVGGRGGGCAEDAGAGRQQSGPKSGEQKPREEMKAEVLPGPWPSAAIQRKTELLKPSRREDWRGRNGGIGLDPADGRSAVEAGVVILEGPQERRARRNAKARPRRSSQREFCQARSWRAIGAD